jgi:quercetin dioxygenase-like cupin family protein
MRAVITSIDNQGRSCVVEEKHIVFDSSGGDPVANTVVWTTESCPPAAGLSGHAMVVDMGLPPGIVRWLALEWEAGATVPFHHTDSVDYAFVFEGSVELMLDDGSHQLGPGDFVVLNGVDHAWKAGPDGCRMSSVTTGTARAQ